MSDTRQQISDAAAKATKSGGLKNLSFRDLAQAVGVKSSSVHYHFPTKPDLAQALVRDYTSVFEDKLKEIEIRHTSVSDRLEALIDEFEAVLADGEICLCGMLASEVTNLDATTKQALGGFFRLLESWLLATVAKSRVGIPGLNKAQLASVLLSGMEGALLMDRVDQGVERLTAMRQLARSL